jgi:RHS repeat-associated protein
VRADQPSLLTNSITTFTFDALNRLETVADAGGTNRYTYDPANNVAIIQLANGTSRTNFYDALNRVTNIFHAGPTGVFASFRYNLAPTGNRRSVQDLTGRTVAWDYDALNRLTRETVTSDPAGQNYAASYVYDAVGNRLYFTNSLEGVTAYQYDDNDQLLTETLAGLVTRYTYDDNGNTLSRSNATESAEYAWTAENRLSAASISNSQLSTLKLLNYQYDDDGIRMGASVTEAGNTTATAYLIDANRPFAQVIEELETRNSEPGTAVLYTYGHGLLSQNRAGVRSYYHADHLGSTRALTGQTGSPTDRYNFDAYGRTLRQTGPTANDYLFAGEQRDKQLGLDYLRARYLNVGFGRFYGRDRQKGQLRTPASLHRYAYAHNNPISYTDPSGNRTLVEVATTVALVGALHQLSASAVLTPLGDPTKPTVRWDATFVQATVDIGKYYGAGGGLMYATSEPLTMKNGSCKQYDGIWIIASGGISLGLEYGQILDDFDFGASEATLYVPSFFMKSENTARAGFSGFVVLGSLDIGYGASLGASLYQIGFGWGYGYNLFGLPESGSLLALLHGEWVIVDVQSAFGPLLTVDF